MSRRIRAPVADPGLRDRILAIELEAEASRAEPGSRHGSGSIEPGFFHMLVETIDLSVVPVRPESGQRRARFEVSGGLRERARSLQQPLRALLKGRYVESIVGLTKRARKPGGGEGAREGEDGGADCPLREESIHSHPERHRRFIGPSSFDYIVGRTLIIHYGQTHCRYR